MLLLLCYWKGRWKYKSRLHLSQLKISDPSTIFPTWFFPGYHSESLSLPLPTHGICERNTFDWNVQLHTNRAPHHSALVLCWTKYLQSYPERFYVLHCNNFSLVLSQAESVWHLIHIRTIVHAKWGPRGIRQRPSDRRHNKSDKVILYYHISYRLLRRRLGGMKLKNGMNLEPEVLLNPAPT
jgi:hypothetical protein